VRLLVPHCRSADFYNVKLLTFIATSFKKVTTDISGIDCSIVKK
jgi:hypothetical protein